MKTILILVESLKMDCERMNGEKIIEDMKTGVKEHPVLKKFLDKGINEYGLSEEEALDIMIYVWLIKRG